MYQFVMYACEAHSEQSGMTREFVRLTCPVCGKPMAFQYFREYPDGRVQQSPDGTVWIDVPQKVKRA